MLNGESRFHVNLGDPSVIEHGSLDVPPLSRGDVEDERGNILRFFTMKPRRLLKRSLLPISNTDCGCGVEKVYVDVVARVAQPHPNIIRVLPLKPRPTQAESSGEKDGVKNPEPSEDFGSTNHIPIDLALPTGDLIRSRPKESPLSFLDALKNAWGAPQV
jgi:hypothetical protein